MRGRDFHRDMFRVGLSTGKYLEEGDLVEAEVERVGVLVNRIRAMR